MKDDVMPREFLNTWPPKTLSQNFEYVPWILLLIDSNGGLLDMITSESGKMEWTQLLD